MATCCVPELGEGGSAGRDVAHDDAAVVTAGAELEAEVLAGAGELDVQRLGVVLAHVAVDGAVGAAVVLLRLAPRAPAATAATLAAGCVLQQCLKLLSE